MNPATEQRGDRQYRQRQRMVRAMRLVYFVRVPMLIDMRRAEERDENQAERVQRGHECAGQSHPVELVMAVGPGLEQDLVLGEEARRRSEEHTSELQSLMRISYAVFCLKKQKIE